MSDVLFYRATKDFSFGGVKVAKDDVVPCHRAPWSALLHYGAFYVRPVFVDPLATVLADPTKTPEDYWQAVDDAVASRQRALGRDCDGAR